MKLTLALSVLMFSSLIHAADAQPKFADNKAKVLQHISAQMTALENTKKCVEAAQEGEAIKKCHEQAKAERMKFQEEMKNEKGHQIEDQMKKLEDKKKALEEKKK
jgi:ketol-acid reductoisomerase